MKTISIIADDREARNAHISIAKVYGCDVYVDPVGTVHAVHPDFDGIPVASNSPRYRDIVCVPDGWTRV